jgi:ribonuclease-3
MPSDQQEQAFAALARRLGHSFADPSLLRRALTHSSHAYEQASDRKPAKDRGNEQMEFLGDAVLGMAAADWLYRNHAGDDEGRLTRLRAALVSRKNLSRVAERLGLGECLQLGRGEELSGGRQKSALLADALEASIAAVYLDGGLPAAAALVEREVVHGASEELREIDDAKSALQEWIQARATQSDKRPEYAVVSSDGPDHARRFTVQLRWKGELLAQATAASKKQAQQLCAQQGLKILREREDT